MMRHELFEVGSYDYSDLDENNTALRYGGAMFTEEFRCYVNVTNTVIKNNSALDYALLVNLYSFYTFDNVM